MTSSDHSSGTSSDKYLKIAEIYDSVIPELVKKLEQMKDLLPQTRANNNNNSNSGNNNGNSGNNGSSHSSQHDNQSVDNEVEKLMKDLIYIGESYKNLKGFEKKASDPLKRAIELLNDLQQLSSLDARPNVSSRTKQLLARLRALNKIVLELKLRIPQPHKLFFDESGTHRYPLDGADFDDSEVVDELPVLHVDKGFTNSSAFRDFRLVYESLDLRTMMCLLCFAVILENENVKKRFMTYWWVGEEFVQVEKADDGTSKELSVEEVADRIFEELAKKDCIEPVNEKHRFVVDSYKMNPLIRSAVIVLAKEAVFFDFVDKGNPAAKWKSSGRACLVGGFDYQELFSESKSKNEVKGGTGLDAEGTGPGLDAEKLESKSKNEVKSGTGSDADWPWIGCRETGIEK